MQARTPVHVRNLFPEVAGLRETILDYMAATTQLAHWLMEGIACWDQANVHAFHGRYGDYLLHKVAKVFPQLVHEVL